jgi:HlyD family secretion protein
MKKSHVIAAVGFVLVIVAGWFYWRAGRGDDQTYRFATVERGDLEATVSATGTLEAVTTVQVGTQVSGQVSALLVDFNDKVKKGQLLARIDPTLQQQAVQEAQAGLRRAQAQFDAAKLEYDRNKQLADQRIITASEFTSIESAYEVARANLTSAQIAVQRARQNLAYTSIYSPIDGIVVERNVDVGQTVAASLSAPQLFLIANDLSRMQILASVDESDIGLIEERQPVRFTVQAYPNERFTGRVQQVRLQSTTTENVVNYTAVVDVDNPDGKLLPGMTATVDFLTGSAEDALTVPNAALRFRPTEAMLAEVAGRESNVATGERDTTRRQVAATAGGTVAPRDSASIGARTGRAANIATLWYIDPAGNLATTRVRTGLTDGQRTEVRGEGLTEDMRIIVGITQASNADGGATSPFQTQPQGGGPRRPGGF